MGQSKPFDTKTILIVEDEAIIRFDLVDFFSEAGYRVFEAASADEAIAVLNTERSIRVVLTDIQMPGSMDGLKLAHYVRDRYPPTVLLLTSGARFIEDKDLPAASVFIRKPFNPSRMLSQIDKLMV